MQSTNRTTRIAAALLALLCTSEVLEAQTWRERMDARRKEREEQKGPDAEDRLDFVLQDLERSTTVFESLVAKARENEELANQLREFPALVRMRLDESFDWHPERRDVARTLAVAVVMQLGEANDLSDFFEVARYRELTKYPEFSPEPLGLLTRTVVAELLARDHRTPRVIRRTFTSAHSGLRPWILHAIGTHREAESISLLIDLFGADTQMDATVLSMVNRLAGTIEPPQSVANLTPIEHALANGTISVRKQAALALGRLKSFESVPLLVELLRHEDEGLQRNAHWSLKKLSGTSLRRDHWTWERWLERENEWWREDANDALSRLHNGSVPQRIAAIKELTHHPLFRAETAPELTLVLHRCTAGEAQLACFALGELGLAPDLEPLILHLEHPQELVRDTALTALQRLTGEDHGADPDAWRYP